MRRVLSLLFIAIALFASAAVAADEAKPLDAKVEKAVRDQLPACPGLKLSASELPYKLPTGFSGTVVRIESDSHRGGCEGQLVAVTSPTGGFFLGIPWYFAGEEGATPEAKLKNFAYRNMQMTMTPVVDRTARTADGLYRVTLTDQTEAGKVAIDGEMDQAGTVFFFGHFRRMNGDMRAERMKAFEPAMVNAPVRGAKDAPVTIVEFSDFQCPSCKYAAGYIDPIVAKHGDKVRYIRYDLPLSGHTWAFPASMVGRAVYRQKPELFWEWKKQVYANQDKLSTFTFDDFARGFAEQHDLDMKRWEADVTSQEIRADILKGVGLAFSNDIRATPSYIVNGALVDAGDNGKALAEYVDKLLAK
jgi:Thioredoxin